MRSIDSSLAAEFAAGSVQPAFLLEYYFDSGMIGMWTGYGDLVVNSITYSGIGNLINISTLEETEDLQARGIVISLNGISTSLISLALSEKLRGRPFRMYLTTVDTSSHIALEDDTGAILLEDDSGYISLENIVIQTPYRIFSGLMDVLEFSDNGETADLRLSVENILITGQRNKIGRYTLEDQRRSYSSDMGLEFINQLQDKQIIW